MATDPERPQINIQMVVNGVPVEAQMEPGTLLLDYLRDGLGLTGAKRSCDVQVCGACTVLLDGLPVSACCTLAYEARGRQVLTIEGLAGSGRSEVGSQRSEVGGRRSEAGSPASTLHPLQEAFVQNSGLQCGFCTSGMILAAWHLLGENPHPTEAELRHYLKGNLCRCTGYWPIFKSILAAAEQMAAQGEK